MFRYITPIVITGIAVAGFFFFAKPILSDISTIKNQIASYDEALNNSKALESERDKLTQKYNSINLNDLARLQKLLPDNVDNIRLILEIEKLALPYGMVLKDVKYDSVKLDTTATGTTTPSQPPSTLSSKNSIMPYGIWNLEFSTEGTYSNFTSFVKDLENNLRIVDISSVAFSSDSSAMPGKPKVSDSYSYSFKIKTYWLKN